MGRNSSGRRPLRVERLESRWLFNGASGGQHVRNGLPTDHVLEQFEDTSHPLVSDSRGLSVDLSKASSQLGDADLPVLSLVTTQIVEGDETAQQSLEFHLDRPSIVPVSFRVSTFENRTVGNHKLEDFDVTLTFLPGQTVYRHAITVLGNNFDEYDTTFAIRFYEPAGLTFAMEVAQLEIVDDDARPTNIIYIMLDDADYYDFGFHSTDAVTPNIDRLREQGLELTRFYSASAICSPTRASVLTGNNPLRFGMNTTWPQANVLHQESKGLRGLPNTIPQLGEALRATGLRTAQFGKWHVGGIRDEYRPPGMGFDEWFLPLTNGDTEAPVVNRLTSHHGEQQITSQEYMTTFLTDRVVDFLDRQAAARTPFFANIWYYAPHWPWVVPPGFDNSTLNFDLDTPRGRLLAMMYEVDKGIGRIVDALTRHSILDETLLIVTSDNGGQRQARTTEGELRGGKGGFNEGGIRVPFVAHWPNEIAANSTNDSVTVTTDLMPTLLEFRGVDAAGISSLESQIDGASKVDTFLSDALISHDPILWHLNGSPNERADPRAAYTYALRVGDYKLVKYEDQTSYRLFNVTTDPGERVNLANHQPARLASMIAQLQAMRRDTSRVPVVPELIAQPITIPFDPRLDVSSGEMTLVFDLRIRWNSSQPVILFDKTGSWRLTLQTDRSLALDIVGVDRLGHTMQIRLTTQPLDTADHEIAIVFGGFKNDVTAIQMYVDQLPVASLRHDERPWNIFSSTSGLRMGADNVRIERLHMYLTRFWPGEWSNSASASQLTDPQTGWRMENPDGEPTSNEAAVVSFKTHLLQRRRR